MEQFSRVTDSLRNFKETRLSGLKPLPEFFNHRQLSRPASLAEASSRVSYNMRNFSGNYLVIVIILAIYALLTNPLLLIAIGFLAGGFMAISKFAPLEVGSLVIPEKNLYIALGIIGLPMLFIASPLSVLFWLVASSAMLILFHAMLMEPGLESEYGEVETV